MDTGATKKDVVHRGYRFGAYTLDIDRAALRRDGKTVHLRRQSFDVLRYLVERAGRLVPKEELLDAIWGNTPVTDDSLTYCLIDIRKALDDSRHELIQTVPRRGFIFDMPVRSQRKHSKQSFRTMAIAACLVAAVTFMLATGIRFSDRADTAESENPLDTGAVALYRQARFLFNRRADGDMEAARSYYLQAIELEPEYADAWAGVAATYYIEFYEDRADASKLAKIKEFAERAIAIDTDNAEGRFRLAGYYWLAGDDEAADRHLQHAFTEHPTDPLLLTVMAGNYQWEGDYDLAIEASHAAVKADPLSLTYRRNLAEYLLAAGRYEEAIEQSTRVRVLGPQSADTIQLVTGLALIKLGKHREAIDVAVAWPRSAVKYEVMAMANFGLGRDSEAARAVSLLLSFHEAGDIFRLAELQAHCDEIKRTFQSLTAMREKLYTDSLFDEMHRQIRSIEMSPFMANVRADSRWAPWLAETRKMMDEDLVLSFR